MEFVAESAIQRVKSFVDEIIKTSTDPTCHSDNQIDALVWCKPYITESLPRMLLESFQEFTLGGTLAFDPHTWADRTNAFLHCLLCGHGMFNFLKQLARGADDHSAFYKSAFERVLWLAFQAVRQSVVEMLEYVFDRLTKFGADERTIADVRYIIDGPNSPLERFVQMTGFINRAGVPPDEAYAPHSDEDRLVFHRVIEEEEDRRHSCLVRWFGGWFEAVLSTPDEAVRRQLIQTHFPNTSVAIPPDLLISAEDL